MRSGRASRFLGNALIICGVVTLTLALGLYVTDPARSGAPLPRPLELASAADDASLVVRAPEVLPTATPAAEPTRPAAPSMTPMAIPSATIIPTPTPVPIKPGVPINMRIPSIKLDSEVREIGTYEVNGKLFWQTIPFLVGHYKTTARAGEKGNAVFSGHVTSRDAGNVFRDLYKVKLGDEIELRSTDATFTYEVTRIRLVNPTETSVMDPTPDATVTLITCAGEWLPEQRDYTQRLIVSAKLRSADQRTDLPS